MQKLYKEDLVDIINDIQHPVWIYHCDNYRFLAANKAALKMLGYTYEELREMTIFDIRSEEEYRYYNDNHKWKEYSFGVNKYYKLQSKEGSEILANISRKRTNYRKNDAVIETVYDLSDIVNYDKNLKKSEHRFRISQEISLNGFLILNSVRNIQGEITDFKIKYINPAAHRFFNINASNNELSMREVIPDPMELFRVCSDVAEKNESRDIELKYISGNDSKFFRYMVVKLDDGVAVSFHDITEHKNRQAVTEFKNKELNEILERISDSFLAVDKNWNLIYLNNSASRIFNKDDKEILGKNFWDSFPFYKDSAVEKNLRKALEEQQPVIFEVEGKLTPRWYRVSVFPSLEGISIYAVDITLSKAYEEQLMSSLRQKETMLKEVHHRIKNNLQIIISILNLQSYYIADPKALEIFRQSQNRIRSMSLIHEKLYKTENLSSINLRNYVADIVKYLSSTYGVDENRINVIFEMDNIELDSNNAISFGLIVNELVSNSFKHAFTKDRSGTVTLRAERRESGIMFELADNGKGFPEGVDVKGTSSLGLQLVNTLVDQLSGKMKIEKESGTKFTITIPYSK
jgi:PAS domain S-box-containing protein